MESKRTWLFLGGEIIMATTMFTNPYDSKLDYEADKRKEARDIAEMSPFDYFAYSAGEAGGQVGRNLGGMLGMQTPEEAKQGKIEEIMGQYGDGAKSYEQLLAIADSFRSANMLDLWEETMGMADEMKGTTTERSNLGKHYQDAMLIEGCEAGDVECEKRARKLR